jgi:hypothetical protein
MACELKVFACATGGMLTSAATSVMLTVVIVDELPVGSPRVGMPLDPDACLQMSMDEIINGKVTSACACNLYHAQQWVFSLESFQV